MISLGLYPTVPIEAARRLRDEASDILKRGTDPSVARRARKQVEAQTFNAIVESWLVKLEKDVEHGKLAPATLKRTRWLLTKYFVPRLGRRPIRLIQPSEVLVVVKRMELDGLRDTPRRALQKCGQLFRYAAGLGAAERDITRDLAGLLDRGPTEHHAGITDPRRLGQLLPSIDRVDSQTSVGLALRLAPLVWRQLYLPPHCLTKTVTQPGALPHSDCYRSGSNGRRLWRRHSVAQRDANSSTPFAPDIEAVSQWRSGSFCESSRP